MAKLTAETLPVELRFCEALRAARVVTVSSTPVIASAIIAAVESFFVGMGNPPMY